MTPTGKEECALHYFKEGYSCAQSVFASFAPELEMGEKAALRLASGLGAGVGRLREVCGAFSALTLILGYYDGNEEGTAEAKEKIYSLVQKEAQKFKTQFGSIICRELLDPQILADKSTLPQERSPQYYQNRPCEACVCFCAREAAQIIQERAK